jgi:adenine-specific DNA-methyltransferase
MNSLLEKEGMAGKVQMVYIDPPYGIRYKSNFQPFVNKREVSESDKDEELTQEPEMIQALRDTWELGIHSYLRYLRDRLWLVKELLHESGSCFVQIGDENLHLVRGIMDEIFGAQNFVVTIPVKKKGSQKSGLMDPVNDYVLWYSKTPRHDSERTGIKYRQLFRKKELDAETIAEYKFVELPDGREFPLADLPDPEGTTRDYRLRPRQVFQDYPGARLFRSNPLTSGGERKNQSLPYEFKGQTYRPGDGNCWKTTVRTDDGSTPGMDRLASEKRLLGGEGQLRFKSYLDDFGYEPMSNWWDSLGGAPDPV